MSRITDAGEKIGGAKKDMWRERGLVVGDLAGMTPEEQEQHVKKDNVWKPDWRAMIDGGADPVAAAVVKVLRDQLAAKPRPRRGEQARERERYVRMMGLLRDRFMAAKTVDDVKNARNALIVQELGDGSGKLTMEGRYTYVSVLKGKRDTLMVGRDDRLKAEKLVAEGWPDKKPSQSNGGNARPKRHVQPKRPEIDIADRPDHRGGRDVTGDDFVRDFGFRGVEFGNWVQTAERQELVNAAYDGLCDLADALEAPKEAVSLDGTLALAFGARGSGQAAAHYEPGRRVINLTRTAGMGALAHEWAHALDHWRGTVGAGNPQATEGVSGWRTRFKTPGSRLPMLGSDESFAWDALMRGLHHRPVTRDERAEKIEAQAGAHQGEIDRLQAKIDSGEHASHMCDQFRREIERRAVYRDKALNLAGSTRAKSADADFGEVNTDLLNAAVELSGPRGYFSRPNEMFARVFESWVADTLAEKGVTNAFLVSGTKPSAYATQNIKANPYPDGEERQRFNSLVDDAVAAARPALEEAAERVRSRSAEGVAAPAP